MISEKPLICGTLESPIGTIRTAVDGAKVVYLSFTSSTQDAFSDEVSRRFSRPVVFSNDSLRALLNELREYFEGKRKRFSHAADVPGCTGFQRKVLAAAARIPYGQIRTYAWLAEQAGSPKAARAAGQVMAGNPVPIIIPCHRVIASSGKLGGFAGGLRALDLKQWLLDLESNGEGRAATSNRRRARLSRMKS